MELFYHGTYKHCVDSIKNDGFRLSRSGDNDPDHWLGDGVYFFIEGLTPKPWKEAKKWAINRSWDNNLKKYKNIVPSVLKCKVKYLDEHCLDLTCSKGSIMLDFYLDLVLNKISKENPKERYTFKSEGYIINAMRDIYNLDIKIVKANMPIKFNPNVMRSKWSRRTPNCTISAIYDTSLIKSIINLNEDGIDSRNNQAS